MSGNKGKQKIYYLYAFTLILVFLVGFYAGKAATGPAGGGQTTTVIVDTRTTTDTKTEDSKDNEGPQYPEEPQIVEFKTTPLGLKPSSWSAVERLLSELSREGEFTGYPAFMVKAIPGSRIAEIEGPAPLPVPTITPIAETVTVATVTGTMNVPEFSATNVRVGGVDEHDIVKTNGTMIYVASGQIMGIYYAYPVDNLELRETVDVGRIIENITGEKILLLKEGDDYYEIGPVNPGYTIRGLYAYMDKIIIIAEESTWIYSRTWIIEYKPGEGVANYKWISGWLRDSRLLNGTLTLVLTQPAIREVKPLINGDLVEPEKLVITGQPRSYTLILALDLDKWTHDVYSILGARPATIYMTQGGSLYIALETPKYKILREGILTLNEVVNLLSGGSTKETTVIAKLQIASGPNITITGSIEIEGILRKTWQLDEYRDVLRIVVETWTGRGINVDLYTINATSMELITELENISLNERIHAVRFMGDKLYLVTFRNIDPLFTIDLSDPANPRVLGFLEAPGFDEYMHPISSDLLIGVGVERVGATIGKSMMYIDNVVRITLYRINENYTVSAIDRIYLFNETMAIWYSHVLNPERGYKAFTIDQRHNYILIPVVGMAVEDPSLRMSRTFNGIAVIRYDANNESIRLVNILEHQGAMRSLYIEDVIYTIAPFNLMDQIQGVSGEPVIKAFDAVSLEPLEEA